MMRVEWRLIINLIDLANEKYDPKSRRQV